MFESAEVRFTKAIAAATAASDANLRNLACVGRARSRINRGQTVGAASDAALVPVSFVFNATADATIGRRNNRVFQQNNQSFSVSIATSYRALTWNGAQDPRVISTNANRLVSN